MIGLDRDPVLEHDLRERLRHAAERGRQRLLHREVEDRLLARGQLDGALQEAADRLGDGEGARPRGARHVAVDPEGGDEPDALLVAAAHLRTEHARCDHAHVARGVEAVERERVAAGHDDERVRRAAGSGATG